MSNYIKATNFTVKDALNTGDPAKTIKGTEIDVEFTAVASAVSSKADTNSPTFTGTPLAPTAASGTSNTQIATTSFVATAVAASFPSGGIIMWSGSIATIPSGWALCNGSNGTPDLRDRFVVGAGAGYAVDATGGSADAIVVSHTHTATSVVTDPTHAHSDGHYVSSGNIYTGVNYGASFMLKSPTTFPNGGFTSPNTTSTAATGITVATTNASTGSSGTNANLPPYYALAYIMKV